MAEYTVDDTKFIMLLLLVAVLFLGVGYYAAKATAPKSLNSNNIEAAQASPQSVQSLLQDKALTDPQEKYTAYRTGLLISHTMNGKVINVTSTNFRVSNNQTTVALLKMSSTAYFLSSNKTRSQTTSSAIKVGDIVLVTLLTQPKTGKSIGSTVDIIESG